MQPQSPLMSYIIYGKTHDPTSFQTALNSPATLVPAKATKLPVLLTELLQGTAHPTVGPDYTPWKAGRVSLPTSASLRPTWWPLINAYCMNERLRGLF